MSTTIYCRTTDKAIQSFYLKTQGKTHFLFSQNFRRGVKKFFQDGVCIDLALDHARAHGDNAILNTMDKLPAYIRYVEREYGLKVLRKTIRKSAERRTRSA